MANDRQLSRIFYIFDTPDSWIQLMHYVLFTDVLIFMKNNFITYIIQSSVEKVHASLVQSPIQRGWTKYLMKYLILFTMTKDDQESGM